MERYSHLQELPNSPLTPLIPLSENTKFEFNFGGDGSLDTYINNVRQEHRVQQQQKKLLQQANRAFYKDCLLQPKRYSEEFLKIRDKFETNDSAQEKSQIKIQNNKQQPVVQSAKVKVPTVKITYTGSKSTPTRNHQMLSLDYANTPTNVREPLKCRDHNIPQNLNLKLLNAQQQQKIKQKQIIQHQQHLQAVQNKNFRRASPVAAKPLCPRVANILQHCGLAAYCDLFHREEIDLLTFHLLRLPDLHQMGITNPKHCAILLQEISYAGQYF